MRSQWIGVERGDKFTVTRDYDGYPAVRIENQVWAGGEDRVDHGQRHGLRPREQCSGPRHGAREVGGPYGDREGRDRLTFCASCVCRGRPPHS